MKKIIVLILLFMTILGCQKVKKLTIIPLNEYINKEIEHGVQFFEIKNHSEYPLNNLMDSILAYSEKELSKNNQMPPKVNTQYFYKETFFGACSDEFIDLDSDFYEDGLQDCMSQRVAFIWLSSSNDKKNDSIFNRKITVSSDQFIEDATYHGGKRKTYITRTYSILIKGTTWKIIKKGKIERN